MEEMINKVTGSSLIQLNPEDFFPTEKLCSFDLREFLFMDQILREKDFRGALLALDWTTYQDQVVALFCSIDAIIPAWAFMLAASYLQPFAKRVIYGTPEIVLKTLFLENIAQISGEDYQDKRVVIKGCGDLEIPAEVYVALTTLLRPQVKSILFGEPCSTVPVFKKK
ncbi:MAG: DUF2480 family protein [Chitinophagaceae bacterium]